MSLIGNVIALFLALVLFAAALHKLMQRQRLTAATAALLRTSGVLAQPLMLSAAAIEAAAATALLIPASRPAGALLAALLWAVYGATLVVSKRRGDSALDCGCSLAASHSGIGGFVIGRAFAFAAAALAVLLIPAPGVGVLAEPLFAAFAFFALFLAIGEMAALPQISRSVAR